MTEARAIRVIGLDVTAYTRYPAATADIWVRTSAARSDNATATIADGAASGPDVCASFGCARGNTANARSASATATIGRGAAAAIYDATTAVALLTAERHANLIRQLGNALNLFAHIGVAHLIARTGTAARRNAAATITDRSARGTPIATRQRYARGRSAYSWNPSTAAAFRTQAAATIDAPATAITD